MQLPAGPVKKPKPSPSRRRTPWFTVAIRGDTYAKLQQVSADEGDVSVAETLRKMVEVVYSQKERKKDALHTAVQEE